MRYIVFTLIVFFSFDGKSQQNKYFFVGKNDTATIIPLKDFIEFKKACYNDSAVSYFRIGRDWGQEFAVPCNEGEIDSFGHVCPAHWSHKTPTFEGFVDWLTKKYNE